MFPFTGVSAVEVREGNGLLQNSFHWLFISLEICVHWNYIQSLAFQLSVAMRVNISIPATKILGPAAGSLPTLKEGPWS